MSAQGELFAIYLRLDVRLPPQDGRSLSDVNDDIQSTIEEALIHEEEAGSHLLEGITGFVLGPISLSTSIDANDDAAEVWAPAMRAVFGDSG